jgi:hypothetical protein
VHRLDYMQRRIRTGTDVNTVSGKKDAMAYLRTILSFAWADEVKYENIRFSGRDSNYGPPEYMS